MKYKPDWQDAKRRLTALWHHDLTDRPCISVTAPNPQKSASVREPATPRQKWLDPDWILADLVSRLENTW
jgi:hypothetical protein